MRTKLQTSAVIIISLLLITPMLGQVKTSTVKVCKWQGITKNNLSVLGVAPTIEKAIAIKNQYNKEYKQTDKEIIHMDFTTESIQQTSDTDYFKNFRKQNPKGYIVHSITEQQTIAVYCNENLSNAISFYSKAKSIRTPEARQYVEDILLKDCQYKLYFKLNLKNILF